ncbi:class I SAM-dependent methyltransferase, partial [Candidatus Omnitrophota bacterium]
DDIDEYMAIEAYFLIRRKEKRGISEAGLKKQIKGFIAESYERLMRKIETIGTDEDGGCLDERMKAKLTEDIAYLEEVFAEADAYADKIIDFMLSHPDTFPGIVRKENARKSQAIFVYSSLSPGDGESPAASDILSDAGRDLSHIPVAWFNSTTDVCKNWITPYLDIEMHNQSNTKALQHNISLLLDIPQIREAIEEKAIMLNLGSGSSPLNDFDKRGIKVVNVDFEHPRLLPKVMAEAIEAMYVSCDLDKLPGSMERIKPLCQGGPVQFAGLYTDMVGWLDDYALDFGPSGDGISKTKQSLINAWGALEASNSFLIVTEPGCEKFIERLELFSDGLREIIVVGDEEGDYKNAKAVVFCKQTKQRVHVRKGMVRLPFTLPYWKDVYRSLSRAISRRSMLFGSWARVFLSSSSFRAALEKARRQAMLQKMQEYNDDVQSPLTLLKLKSVSKACPITIPELVVGQQELPGEDKFLIQRSSERRVVVFDVDKMKDVEEFSTIYWDVVGDIYLSIIGEIFGKAAAKLSLEDFSYSRLKETLHTGARARFIATCDLEPHEIVLDLGTLYGTTVFLAAEKCQRVVGVDISSAAIDKVREIAALCDFQNVEFMVGDLTHPLFAEQSFHAIISQYMFYMLPPQLRRRVLKQAHRALKENGKLRLWVFHPDNRTCKVWGIDEWISELQRAGFKVRSMDTISIWRKQHYLFIKVDKPTEKDREVVDVQVGTKEIASTFGFHPRCGLSDELLSEEERAYNRQLELRPLGFGSGLRVNYRDNDIASMKDEPAFSSRLSPGEDRMLGLLLDRKINFGSASSDEDGPLEHVEDRLGIVLRGILNYADKIEAGRPNPYLNPQGYIDHMCTLFSFFWKYMDQDGRYQLVVKHGLAVCLAVHLKDLREESFAHPVALRRGYAGEIADIVEYIYEQMFGIYLEDLVAYWDFEHHREGRMFHGEGSSDHLYAFYRHLHCKEDTVRFYGEEGFRGYLSAYKHHREEQLYCLDLEAQIYRRRHQAVLSGAIGGENPFDPDKEIDSAHVRYGDPVLRKCYFTPFAHNVYATPSSADRNEAIRGYLEDKIQGSPKILEVGSGRGTLGAILNESRL